MKASKSYARLSRRRLLKQLACAPTLLRAAPLYAGALSVEALADLPASTIAPPTHDLRVSPKYPSQSPLEDVLRLAPAGSDQYVTEKYAFEIAQLFERWRECLRTGDYGKLRDWMSPGLQAPNFASQVTRNVKHGSIETETRQFVTGAAGITGDVASSLRRWLGDNSQVERADFEITSIRVVTQQPLSISLAVRYDVLTSSPNVYRKQHIGQWAMDWRCDVIGNGQPSWKLTHWQTSHESVSSATAPVFVDVTRSAFGDDAAFKEQLSRGSDYWRSVLDGACGIDIYGNNGVATGDFDNDGADDLYICQPAGLPNRLYKNRGDGTFEDVTYRAGVGVLDNTSCALFADFRNVGLQDLLVVCGSGPLLFLNRGDGTFQLKKDAFQFATAPQGTFTHAAAADYDLDGRLDVYFCTYSYYLGLDQYHYPVPYFDARNGPPNFLLRNIGDGTFVDATAASGMNADNDRYTFAAAWGHSSSSGAPDLYVVNDFGRNVLYRNKGNGTFAPASHDSKVEDVGAGMSAAWADTTNNGRSDIYAADMWSAAGQRVSTQPEFHSTSEKSTLKLYQKHAEGNAFYVNQGAGAFENAATRSGVDVGRWAWCSDFWDFDHDGHSDLYVTNGYITAPQAFTNLEGARPAKEPVDLGSFFWRQVVGRSPDDSTPSVAYERGWNAINELIRSDYPWSGSERNSMFANNRDGTFTEVSGVVGMDFLEDGRAFCLSDLDGDGRLEVIVKNRNAPQVRILRNNMKDLSDSVGVRLVGTKSNRDAIGTSVRLTIGKLDQRKYLQAGSGFLAQHSKELSFGLGNEAGEVRAVVQWSSGMQQEFTSLPRNHSVTLTEGSTTYTSKSFRKDAGLTVLSEKASLPTQQVPSGDIETWLINPLRAPSFRLPTHTGSVVDLESVRGKPVLLHFTSNDQWSKSDIRAQLERHSAGVISSGAHVLVVFVGEADSTARGKTSSPDAARLPQAISFAHGTDEMLGIYNILYRYLFDRRRDLPIPSSLLIDGQGMLVKLYQGRLTVETLVRDITMMYAKSEEGAIRGLPFKGSVYQASFVRNDFTYGVAMFQHGYLNEAESSFQQVIASRPNDAEAHYNLGTLNLRQNKFDSARLYLRETLRLKPDYAEAWNNLGMMDAQEGKLSEAITNFRQSTQLRPTYATAYLNMGNAYRKLGDTSAAKAALMSALQLQGDDPETNYSVGLYYAQQGELGSAESYLSRAIDLRTNYPEARTNLGVLFVRKGDYPKAEEQFQRCIELSPDYEQSYINLARLYAMLHQNEKARTALQLLLEKRPNSSAAQNILQQLNTLR